MLYNFALLRFKNRMSPELLVWLLLAVKVGLTALVVIAVTVAAEKGGALAGAFLATLPIVPGPVFVLLALDHDAHFIANAATFALAANCMSASFGAVYVVLAQRNSLLVSIAVGTLWWIAGASIIGQLQFVPLTAALLTFSVLAVCFFIVRPYREAVIPRVPLRAVDFVMRGVFAAAITAVILIVGETVGSSWAGALSVFPVMFGSIAILLHPRLGGHAAAAVIANANIGMYGFCLCALTVALMAERIGSFAALSLALAVSIIWNLSVFGLRRRRMIPKSGPRFSD
jgi:hypothetical protein